MYADKNHPVRLAGSMQERGMVSKPAAVFYVQRRVVHSELVDLQSRKNHHCSDRKDKSEFYESSSQESHRTAWMFANYTESCLFAMSARRFGGVSITVQTMTDISKELNQRTRSVSHTIPDLPWQYVALDLMDYASTGYLVTVDYYSDFFEVDRLQDKAAEEVILKAHFT